MEKSKKRYLKVDVDEDDWKKVRIMALMQGKTVNRFMVDGIMKLIEEKEEKAKKTKKVKK